MAGVQKFYLAMSVMVITNDPLESHSETCYGDGLQTFLSIVAIWKYVFQSAVTNMATMRISGIVSEENNVYAICI